MNSISKECRLEAWLNCEPQKRCRDILKAMGDAEMTAREIAYKLGFSDLNAVKPRLCEMTHDGKIEIVGKLKDTVTGRTVSVYKVVQ